MSSVCNPECQACEKGMNCINGRYCRKLGRYVDYAPMPPCKEKER